ncbi:uncharacterized protein LOC143363994 [Halictus rubicundus]|uniref:uncharacterized protein LOC143363994 n=1 Tax=Halictus rubicundus TaxID=77578 RepID=UPI004035A621
MGTYRFPDLENYLEASDFIAEVLKTTTSADAASSKGVSTSPIPTSRPTAHLPRIQLPSFDGSFEAWESFRDRFTSMVIDEPSLANVDRLHFLCSSLKGEASNAIAHLPITDNNFAVAWKLITSRYENKRRLITTHLATLFSLPKVTSESAPELRNLRDRINASTQALKNLNRPVDQWSDIIVFLGVQNLDRSSRKAWELKLETASEFPTYAEFDTFLESRSRALEAMAPIQIGAPTETLTVKRPKAKSLATHVTAVSTVTCPVCRQNHLIYRCPAFVAQSPSDRYNIIKTRRRCINCFSAKHANVQCPSQHHCKECKQRHHTLLHFPRVSEDPRAANPSPAVASENKPTISANLVSDSPTRYGVLLSTAHVQVHSQHGRRTTVQALLDQGSAATLISERTAQLLRLNRTRQLIRVTGIGEAQSVAHSTVRITVSPAMKDRPAYSTTAVILKTLTNYVPPRKRTEINWSHISDLELADSNPMSSEPIDLIIGADLYSQLIVGGIRRGLPATPVAQNTTLGWILSGPIASSQTLPSIGVHHCASIEPLDQALRRTTNGASTTSVIHIPVIQLDATSSAYHFDKRHLSIPILGIAWIPALDRFQVRLHHPTEPTNTKRAVLSVLARLFDPLGWIAPVVVTAKLIMQRLWAARCDWDEPIPDKLHLEWQTYLGQLPDLAATQIPRPIASGPVRSRSLHGFADASSMAYAAAVYIRSVLRDGRVEVALLVAKSRVAPVKTISVPRLELSATLLLANLVAFVRLSLRCEQCETHCWTDSSIVLTWLSQSPAKWKTFFANRVAKIQTTRRRVLAPCPHAGQSRRLCFTRHFSTPTPESPTLVAWASMAQRNPRVASMVSTPDPFDLASRYSSWPKLIRVTAYVQRFIKRLRSQPCGYEMTAFLPDEVASAKSHWLKRIQADTFPQELRTLAAHGTVPKSSPLSSLNPYLDSDGLIRAKGRLSKAQLPENARSSPSRASDTNIGSCEHAQQCEPSCTAFLAAYHRFVSRRGIPRSMASDNGTTFQGANRELTAAYRAATRDTNVRNKFAIDGVSWHFLPPAAPHFGGLWEAAIKSVKHHLRRCIGAHTLTFEELSTFLCRVEACLNSRLIASTSDCFDDYSVLTPGHFLIGAALVASPEASVLHLAENRLSRWQLIHRLTENFWKALPLQLINSTDKGVAWKNPVPSSPGYCRPIRIRFVKETTNIINGEVNYIQTKIRSLQETKTTENNRSISVKHNLIFTMLGGCLLLVIIPKDVRAYDVDLHAMCRLMVGVFLV